MTSLPSPSSTTGAAEPTASESSAAATAPRADAAAAAGRGGLAVTGAKAWFIVAGLVQQVLLSRVLGLDGYGALSSALSAASIVYNPLVGTSIQAVSRTVAQREAAERPQALRAALLVQAALAGLVAVGFFFAASPLADAMGAPHLLTPLRGFALVVASYGLYAPLIGALNGERRFVAQASFDVASATLRTFGVVGGAVLGGAAVLAGAAATTRTASAVNGAVAGLVLAAVIVLVGAAVVVLPALRGGSAGSSGGVARYLAFFAPVFGSQLLTNLLLQADVTLLRRFASEATLASGAPAAVADQLVGAYRAGQLFAFLPYQLLTSITFVLFPLLTSAHQARDREAVRSYVEGGLRIAAVVAGAMVAVTASLPAPLLTLVFGAEAARLGASSLAVLAPAFGGFALLAVLVSVLTSVGRERDGLLVTGLAFTLVLALGFGAVRGTAADERLLTATAVATAIALAFATLTATAFVRRATGALLPPLTLVRVVAATAFCVLLGRALTPWLVSSRFLVLPAAAVIGVAYLLLLGVSRELGARELAYVRRVVGRKPA